MKYLNRSVYSIFIFFGATAFWSLPVAYGGSCSEAKLCCPGRDSSCVVQKTPINSISEDVNEKPCYCDHACLKLGDCCPDFKKACKVVDCLVSIWEPWGECDADCGTGMMSRRRTVLRQSANGGKHCPSLIQKRGCLGTNCPLNPRSALKEIAIILPVTKNNGGSNQINGNSSAAAAGTTPYATAAGLDSFKFDESDNEDDDIEDDVDESNNKEYCVLFEVLKATKACRKESQYSLLREGEKVCVLCENEAMRPSLGYRCTGHGTMDRSTRWSALSAPHCHGKWVRLDSASRLRTTTAITRCPVCASSPKFVFV